MVETKANKKKLVGVVVSSGMEKSAVVETERLVRHKLYGKFLRRRAKYMAHDPENSCSVGDRVMIEECRPMSKRKRWRIKEIIEKSVSI